MNYYSNPMYAMSMAQMYINPYICIHIIYIHTCIHANTCKHKHRHIHTHPYISLKESMFIILLYLLKHVGHCIHHLRKFRKLLPGCPASMSLRFYPSWLSPPTMLISFSMCHGGFSLSSFICFQSQASRPLSSLAGHCAGKQYSMPGLIFQDFLRELSGCPIVSETLLAEPYWSPLSSSQAQV